MREGSADLADVDVSRRPDVDACFCRVHPEYEAARLKDEVPQDNA
jgi:hypothetical protein